MIRVVSAGMLTTVQDLGRPGYADIGVSASGAADALALRAGNRLVGNPEGAGALELTMMPAAFEFTGGAFAAFTGGLAVWESFPVRAGEVVRCPPLDGGARGYLCVRGGIAAARVLGSVSLHAPTGVGGAPLKKGDLLPVGLASGPAPRPRRVAAPQRRTRLRVTAAPQSGWFGEELYAAEYRVSAQSNRMGVRLEGAAIRAKSAPEMITEGVPLGAVQVPSGGQPIILFVEHQTTGGYPKIANVISADLRHVGQLRPGDRVTFERVGLKAAIEALREQEEWLERRCYSEAL